MKIVPRPRILASIVATSVLMLGGMAFAAPAEASTPTPTPPPPATSTSLSIIEANAVVVGGVPTFYYSRAVSEGASLSDVEQFAAGVRAAGSGKVVGGPVAPATRSLQAAQVAGCGGVTKVTSNWAGHTVYMNSCDANTLVGIMTGGGGVAGGIGYIFAATGFAIPLVVFGAVAAVFAGWVAASNNRNQGVEVHEPYIGLMYVTSQ